MDVIIDDLAFFGQPYFQDGTLASVAAAAVANGVVYVTVWGIKLRNTIRPRTCRALRKAT